LWVVFMSVPFGGRVVRLNRLGLPWIPVPTTHSHRPTPTTRVVRYLHSPSRVRTYGHVHSPTTFAGVFGCANCKAVMSLLSDGGAQLSVVRHQPGCPTLLAPWPAAPNDCEAAALWLIESAESRFGSTRSTISGVSAGATLAATTLLRLRDRGIDSFADAVLRFGTYDLSGQTPAGRLIADEYFLDGYVGRVPDRCAPDISPIYAELSAYHRF
jgi:alpha/beta hydrolase fold